MQRLIEEQAQLLDRFEALGGYQVEAKAKQILAGLGFSNDDLLRPLTAFSGGWVMRAQLAKLLLSSPDLLLLDEPTNHLDLESLEWLEGFLSDYRGAWLVVSHDRYFLDRRVSHVAELKLDELYVVPGNYSHFLTAREEREAQLEAESKRFERKRAEQMRFVDRFRAKASKAKQAQSRLKQIERADENRPAAPAPTPTQSMRFPLPDAPRSGNEVLLLRNIDKKFGEQLVYKDLNFLLQRGRRVALVGVNGAGKSTLLKMLAGVLEPDAGERVVGHKVAFHYYAQHQAETLDPDRVLLDLVWETMPTESESRVRGRLGAFLFHGDDVQKPIRVLSGGEKARVALALMLARPLNCLFLDEPTSHLDLQSREVLEETLCAFEGSLVCISHDRFFVNKICTEVAEVRPGGEILRYPGSYDDYLRKKAVTHTAPAPSLAGAASSESGADQEKVDRVADRKAERQNKKEAERAARIKARALEEVQGQIESTEARIEAIDAKFCEEATLKDPAAMQSLGQERATLETSLAELYERWSKLDQEDS